MHQINLLNNWFQRRRRRAPNAGVGQALHIDWPLLITLLLLVGVGLVILYSAGGQSMDVIERQGIRIGIAFLLMWLLAQVPPDKYQLWAPWLFAIGVLLLLAVLAIGVIGKGAQRWLNLWVFQFQPSEIMKLAVPMMLAWYLRDRRLPPNFSTLITLLIIIFVPAVLVAKQPDLGTAMLIGMAGCAVLILAGISWRLLASFVVLAAACTPLLWHFMHDYQKQRVLIFLNPERDPLNTGYHIIQSKIAIGSGGLFGKGWLNGTQSHLQFLPEHATDFIFAVSGEEFGLLGAIILLTLYLVAAGRGLYISANAQDTFSRLLAGGISLTFLIAAFVNIGMVSGVLPVVGVPLPLVSYGGTSLITLIACFGVLMSIHTHRKLLGK
jgi:rod shape determining protein RodA